MTAHGRLIRMGLGSRVPVKGREDASCGPTQKAQHATGQSDQRNARTPLSQLRELAE